MPIIPDAIVSDKIVPCRLGYMIFNMPSCISPFVQVVYLGFYFCLESLFSCYLIIVQGEGGGKWILPMNWSSLEDIKWDVVCGETGKWKRKIIQPFVILSIRRTTCQLQTTVCWTGNVGRGRNMPLICMNILRWDNHTTLLVHNNHPVQKTYTFGITRSFH